nr:Uncharacterised protein [Raoultella sp. NCTC 9187]
MASLCFTASEGNDRHFQTVVFNSLRPVQVHGDNTDGTNTAGPGNGNTVSSAGNRIRSGIRIFGQNGMDRFRSPGVVDFIHEIKTPATSPPGESISRQMPLTSGSASAVRNDWRMPVITGHATIGSQTSQFLNQRTADGDHGDPGHVVISGVAF